MASAVDKLYDKPLAELQKRITQAENRAGLNQAPSYQEYLKNPGKYAPYGAQAGQSNQDANLETTREIARRSGVRVTASGGVGALEDIARLTELESDGVDSVIVGKALYENRFTLKQALKAAARVS